MLVAFLNRLKMQRRIRPLRDPRNTEATADVPAVEFASVAKPSMNMPSATVSPEHTNLDELARVARQLLMDENLEVSRIRPFFWTLVEAYVARFQLFPFDAVKSLFNYLELNGYPEHQLRDLIDRLENLYQQQHGIAVRQPVAVEVASAKLEDEINELRNSLKYAAIAAERIESYE